jgi:predicted DNA-binding transcriptional regulator YafY
METPKLLRCIELANLFQSGHYIQVQDIAASFNVCKRTIFRDIRSLKDVGLPVQSHKRKRGQFSGCGPRLRLSLLDEGELILLVASICTSNLMNHPVVRGQIQISLAKLLNQCPEYLRFRLLNIVDSLKRPCRKRELMEIKLDVFTNVFQALKERKLIRFRLSRAPGETKTICTKVAPYHFDVSSDSWYVIGRSSWHRRVVDFNLQDINQTELTEEDYEIPLAYCQ